MSNGPTIIFDKSLIQALNKAEARSLGWLYPTNITPILFIEILADLYKAPPEGRTPEKVVADLAAKVETAFNAYPNAFHVTLATGDLLGYPVEMDGRPLVGGGQIVKTADGREGVFFDEDPESEALRRWGEGDFQGVERDFAQGWRKDLENLDLKAVAKAIQSHAPRTFGDLSEVKAAADEIIDAPGRRYAVLKGALNALGIPEPLHTRIITRWKQFNGPVLREFAPYADYLLRVETFFQLALASGLIRRLAPSHRTDIAYLFYLPFCRVFTSCDHFHREVVPLFQRPNQIFVEGRVLKADLAALAAYYDALPAEARAKGSRKYAAYPPLDGDFLSARIYDRLVPRWRQAAVEPEIEMTPERNEKIMKHLKPFMDAIEARKRRQ